MCFGHQLLKGSGFAHLENIEQVSCHTLDAHLHNRGFKYPILALKVKCAPTIDVAQHWFVFPLFCVGQLNHADSTLGTMEPLLHVSMKWATCCFELAFSSNCWNWRLVAMRHVEHINSLGVRLAVEVRFECTSPKLCLNCICNRVLGLFDGN